MQIIRLKVDNNNCLFNFDIHFEISTDCGSSTVLIGQNGTGKSTMLQTVLEILMSFMSDAVEKKILYNYELEYFYKGSRIIIQQSKKNYTISLDGEIICTGKIKTIKEKLAAMGKSIVPERISYFYSDLNNSAISTIKRIDANYAKECRNALVRYWNALYLANHTYEGDFSKRKFNYCTEALVPVYLISIVCGTDSFEKTYLLEQCHITQIELISTILSVKGLRGRLQNDIVEAGNEGICDLISFLDDRFTEIFRSGFVYQDGEQFVYELHNIIQVDADSISFFDFFEKLTTLFDAEFDVTVRIGNTSVNCNNFSEGQRQLIKILGMLGICKSEDTLVLMDEPDAHMNPNWKYDIKATIDRCLDGAINTQAIIATHDPLVINGVDKRHIRVFVHDLGLVRNSGRYLTKVIEPTEDTEGLGIDGLLQSEYYGLKTSYDRKSTDKFLRRQELYTKLINGDATEEEKDELRTLTRQLGILPMSYNSIDFLYDDFVRVFKNTDLFAKEYLSYEDVQRRREKIKEIIAALYEGEV